MSIRKIQNMRNVADEVGAPKVMEFYSVRDEQSGIELAGIHWQRGGTGDVFLSAAVLFGVGVGNRGGAIGTGTDYGGCLIRTE